MSWAICTPHVVFVAWTAKLKEDETEPLLFNFQDSTSHLRVLTKSDTMPLLHRPSI